MTDPYEQAPGMETPMTSSVRLITTILPLCVLLASASARGGELWVDNARGDDAGPGTQVAPFRTIERALRGITPGTTVHVQPTAEPYPSGIRVEVSGAPDAPIILDGHGSLVSGMRRAPPESWKAEGNDVFSQPLPNNAWGMPRHWEGGFELVRFAGQPGRNVTTRDALEPLSYFLYKNQKELKTDPLHNTLYIRLPPGKTPADLAVESIAGVGGIYVGGSHVTVRNFICEYGGVDGFATHRNKGVVFENIEARYFMDQGMSHHGAEVVVRRAHFHHNAGCGVVDVYPEVKVRYEQCLIEADTWRGGVEFHSGEFEMVDCLIRANPKTALTVTKGARVKLRNCLLVAPEPGTTTGIRCDGDGGTLDMEDCTLYGFAAGLQLRLTTGNRVTVNRCAWLRCQLNTGVRAVQTVGAAPVDLAACLHFTGNVYDSAPWEVLRQQQQDGGGWKTETFKFAAAEHAGFAAQLGTDTGATVRPVDGATDPLALPPLVNANGAPVGAHLPQPFTVGVVRLPSPGQTEQKP